MGESFFKALITKFRKRHIIETLAAFIGGGWLLIEVVERLLVSHYGFPEKTIDLTVVSVIGALLSTLVWRWFRHKEKRPGNIKVEILLVPLIILAALAIDLALILQIAGILDKKLLIGIVAFLLGIAWIIFKSLQWAAITPSPVPGKEPSVSFNPREIAVKFTPKKLILPVAVLAGLIAAGLFFLLKPSASELDPKRVVVVPFENKTGDPKLDNIGFMASDWITKA